jgi:pimeloyl-ACP methyl ester carboxylesterase
MPLHGNWTGLALPSSTSPGIPSVPGSPLSWPRGAGPIRSSRSLPTGWGTPLERVYQAAVLTSGRALATLLAPNATQVAATGAGRSLFFAMERSRPWQLPAEDARQLLLDFAEAPGYLETVRASMVDVPAGLERITCPVLFLQGTADPLVSMQSPRFLVFVPHAQLQWLPGLSHVPISDDPRLVASLMLRFLKTTTDSR